MSRVHEAFRGDLTQDEIEYLEYLLEDDKRQCIALHNWARVDSIQSTINKLNEVKWML
jgi:3-phosphoglycerate kinase